MSKSNKVKVTLSVRSEQAEWLRYQQRIGNLEIILDSIIRIRTDRETEEAELFDKVLDGSTEAAIEYLKRHNKELQEYSTLNKESGDKNVS